MYQEIEKLFSVKIPVKKEEFANYYIELQTRNNKQLETNINNLKNYLKNKDIQDFIKEKNDVIENIVSKIKASSDYIEFNEKYSEIYKQSKSGKSKNKILSYMKNNKLKEMNIVSFDIIEGNFNAFKIPDPNNIPAIFNFETYKEFFFSLIERNALTEILVESKSIRQVIFGKLNPKLSTKILTEYISQIDLDLELVIESQDEKAYITDTEYEAIPYIKQEHIKITLIDEIPSYEKTCLKQYYKEEKQGKISLKLVPKKEFIALYKREILKEELIEKDFFFEEDGAILTKIVL
jgi:hypothetical protein